MRTRLLVLASCFVLAPVLRAGHDGESTIWVTRLKGEINGGWVVQFPTGSSDFFNVTHPVVAGSGNSESVVAGLPITGIGVAVTSFGGSQTFPIVGVYIANLGLDPSGNTPDLSQPISTVMSPPIPSGWPIDLPEGSIPPGAAQVHPVVQLPPGDSGLLGVGASTTSSPSGGSGYTIDGYATPAITLSFLDFGLNPGQDNDTTTSCQPAARSPHGRLRIQGEPSVQVGAGDHLTTTVRGGDPITLAFFGNHSGDQFRIVMSAPGCGGGAIMGPVLSALDDADGDGSFLRVPGTWPFGHGSSTFQFSAVWGNDACSEPGAGFTNCVTVISLPDPIFGICDDGTIESAWILYSPTGSSDYFNNDFGLVPPSVNDVLGLTVSVLDFVTATPAFPRAGISDANLAVDPSGATPDVQGAGLLCLFAPFTFPSGTFATTVSQYVSHSCPMPVPGSSFSSHAHGWVQFPPGDSGLVTVGADTTVSNGCSYFSLDGYTTPAISFLVNWGIRAITN
jgi:hypothetical protein